MASQSSRLLELLVSATNLANEIQHQSLDDPATRHKLADAANILLRTIQSPVDRAWLVFHQPHHLSTLRVALDAGWLTLVAEADGTHGITARDIAEKTNTDAYLVARLMRLLAAGGSVREVGPNTYATNEMVQLFVTPGWSAGVRHAADEYSITSAHMPDYFAKNGYREPAPHPNTIYSHVHGTPAFELMMQQPKRLENFQSFISIARPGRKHWIDVYPSDKLQVRSKNDVLVVDVGGARGDELRAIVTKRLQTGLAGRLVLQDRQEAIDGVPSEWRDDFEVVVYDFFTPQPAAYQHARAYYMRAILHDWPDADCATILAHVRDAMEPGYSTIMINEIVLPDTGCSWQHAAHDVTMMAAMSGKERTLAEWRGLIEGVEGLKIEKIWTLEEQGESLIEVVRVS
ncbi:hypothetical protein LTS10_010880 [Elasticomyces elasticus]|nr:hypothetical protein LTS10_010880 [Elasticomyces elasticus]